MKKYLGVAILCLLAACSHSVPDQQPMPILEDSTMEESEPQPAEPDVQILPPLDSSAYSWRGGYLVLPWSTLAQVEFNWAYSDEMGQEVPFPIFGPTLRVLDGQQVEVSGYVIPVEESGSETIVILSAFPYSQCFFCGQAGPESVIDILAGTKLPRLSLDEKISFRGRLRLNDDDLRYLNYMLEAAELVK